MEALWLFLRTAAKAILITTAVTMWLGEWIVGVAVGVLLAVMGVIIGASVYGIFTRFASRHWVVKVLTASGSAVMAAALLNYVAPMIFAGGGPFSLLNLVQFSGIPIIAIVAAVFGAGVGQLPLKPRT